MKTIRKTNFILFLLMFYTVTGCGNVPASPTQPPVESTTTAISTLTSRPALTPTPQPTATEEATPTLTTEPSLQTDGPYFTYFQQENLVLRLVFVDADGKGRKVIELPKALSDAYAYGTLSAPDIRFVSPDGHWLAFYTGSAGQAGELPTPGTSDLALNLLDLTTGEQQIITPLLSEDYPNNFVEAAKKLNDPDIRAESLYQAFADGITRTLAWSPDGKYLAFGGQMDGLSSDLYTYDVETKAIQRLSSGDQELQWINWSPDGKWIVHSGVYAVGAGMTFDIYAAKPGSATAPYISTNVQYDGIDYWLNDHQYFENDGDNGPGEYGLRLVDLDTGRITRIWDGSFSSYAVARGGEWVALYAQSPDTSPYKDSSFVPDFDFVPAIYLINVSTLEKTRVEFPNANETYGQLQSFGLNGQEFVIVEGIRNPKAVFLSTDGSLTQTDLGDASMFISPNSEYWLAVTTVTGLSAQNFVTITDQTVDIFARDNTHIKNIPFYSLQDVIINHVTWQPDSSGVFLISGTQIFSMDVPSGDIKPIETNLMDAQGLYYGWVSGR